MLSSSWSLDNQHTVIQNFVSKLKRHPKRIVFSEGEDERVIQAAEKLVELEAIAPILLGNREVIEQKAAELGVSLKFVGIKDPKTSGEKELFCDYYSKSERFRGVRVANVEETVEKPQNFAAIMVQYGFADAMLGGNQVLPSTVFRAASNMIKPVDDDYSPFGVSLVINKNEGQDAPVTVMSDTAIIPNPTLKELTFIAKQTAIFTKHILGHPPLVAMLSHGTRGSSYGEDVSRVRAATELIQDHIGTQGLAFDVIGEVQADVALNAASYDMKLESKVPFRRADALVFPDLDAANISFHMLENFANISTLGHFIKGFTRPVAQVSRSVDVDALISTAVILGSEAIKYRLLYDKN